MIEGIQVFTLDDGSNERRMYRPHFGDVAK